MSRPTPPPPHPGLPELADVLRALPPSLGGIRLVGVDGHAGSGKTTFAGELAEACGGAPVLHLDDVATHEELFSWTARLQEQLLIPLSRGEEARWRPYDWRRREFAAARVFRPAPVVIMEGVGACRRALRPLLAASVWADLGRAESWERGRRRDGPELAEFWQRWTAAESAHFAADPSRWAADWLVSQLPGRDAKGRRPRFDIRPGPAAVRTPPSLPGTPPTQDSP